MYKHYWGNKFYEIMVDDTILIFENITKNQDTYESIFENPILLECKSIHDLYGTVFNFACFYRLDENATGGKTVPSDQYEIGWTLNRMTERFKSEFEANSDWLKFSFHSYAYDIRYPYVGRDPGTDYVTVRNEVFRFAGKNSWVNNYVKCHWYYNDKQGILSIKEKGPKMFIGSPRTVTDYRPIYHLNENQILDLFEDCFYYDEETGIPYIQSVANVERIQGHREGGVGVPTGMYEYLDNLQDGYYPHLKKQIDYFTIETHEIIFLQVPEVVPEYRETARWCYDNGYKPAFFKQSMLKKWARPLWI